MTAFLLVTAAIVVAVGVPAILLLRRRAARRRAIEEIEMSDELTGVGNRRRLDRDLAVESASADTPVAVIKIDVDQFHRINDEHGRPAGDAVLCQLADVLRAEVRTGDVVYRYADEEFCVLLARTTTGEAGLVAERMRFAVSQMQLAVEDSVTVSIGVALGRGEHVKQTMQRADEALAKSKYDGCDRVTLAVQPLLGPLAVTHHLD
ncbi:MAG TPA: GGDEF domain-containing protein [Ilumatobacteraceae bacterium]|jgi:diguanylate cyclase (GGDEF)-like protein